MPDPLRGRPGEAEPAEQAPQPRPPRLSGPARTLILGAAVAVAFVVGAGATALMTADGPPDNPGATAAARNQLEGRVPPTKQAPLPAATLEAFGDGEQVDLADYRGEPLIVNFWASWCAPCVGEMPELQEVAGQLAGRVPLLGVNVQDAPANAQAFVDELDITYDLAADPRGAFYAEVEAFGMPTTLLVDPGGTIVYRHTGIIDADGLRGLVAEHLGVEA